APPLPRLRDTRPLAERDRRPDGRPGLRPRLPARRPRPGHQLGLHPRAPGDEVSSRADGMSYAPQGKPAPVVGPGAFRFAAMHLDHGHINGMCRGLIDAGGELTLVYEPDPAKLAAFQKAFPHARAARSAEEVLEDAEVRLVAAAAVTSRRGPLGCRVMRQGKD